jgi:hypothetical protein
MARSNCDAEHKKTGTRAGKLDAKTRQDIFKTRQNVIKTRQGIDKT